MIIRCPQTPQAPNDNHRRTIIQSRTEIRYGYDSVYLTCSKKLTGSQLSLPHGPNKKLKLEAAVVASARLSTTCRLKAVLQLLAVVCPGDTDIKCRKAIWRPPSCCIVYNIIFVPKAGTLPHLMVFLNSTSSSSSFRDNKCFFPCQLQLIVISVY